MAIMPPSSTVEKQIDPRPTGSGTGAYAATLIAHTGLAFVHSADVTPTLESATVALLGTDLSGVGAAVLTRHNANKSEEV